MPFWPLRFGVMQQARQGVSPHAPGHNPNECLAGQATYLLLGPAGLLRHQLRDALRRRHPEHVLAAGAHNTTRTPYVVSQSTSYYCVFSPCLSDSQPTLHGRTQLFN